MRKIGEEDEGTVKRDGKQLASMASRLMQELSEPLVLVVSTPSGGLILPVPEEDVVHLGRSRECELPIPDISVSRRHLRLFVRAREIEDLGSANGSSYDGVALEPHTRVRIELGQAIRLGDVTVYVHAARTVVAPDAAPASARGVPTVGLIVRDEALMRVYALLPTIAPSPLSVLILGETGVGKEVYADAIHRASPRAGKSFLKLNCAALPESILEGELFGYEKGAFSGAVQARPGLFESAHGGTVFLDEVGELTLATQAKLLRVLESGEVLRLGSRVPIQVDVRFVAATNRDLEADVAAGSFRRDLFYRLEGVRVFIPPLRERPEDIVALAEYFLVRLAARMKLAAPRLSDAAKRALIAQTWPGNVRELRNVLERAFVMNPTVSELDERHVQSSAPKPQPRPAPAPTEDDDTFSDTGVKLRAPVSPPPPAPVPAAPAFSPLAPVMPFAPQAPDLKASLNAVERQAILDALERTGGNQSAAAKMLGIGRHALIARIEAYGITRPRKK